MESDVGIEFGDLEEKPPRVQLRPDESRQLAVVACGQPAEDELRIFIELDALAEIEEHAQSNRSVELGGVLLGGRYLDGGGRPFVVIADSLRAAHYESTRGSFKFTHETWAEITRQRSSFPAELEMVGWYHTHPDWGVFLSGRDLFICEHFFNKPLDVALVVDPCRGDRGFFQWTTSDPRETRRTGGYYVVASRHRRAELESFVATLPAWSSSDEESSMARSFPGQSPYPGPLVAVTDPRIGWQAAAVLGMLSLQFILVAALAWRLLAVGPSTSQLAVPGEERLRARQQVLDEIISQLDVAPERLVTALASSREANETLQAANLGLAARVETLTEQAATAHANQARLETRLKEMETQVARWQSMYDEAAAELAALEEAGGNASPGAGLTAGLPGWWSWKWTLTSVALAAGAVAGGMWAVRARSARVGEQSVESGGD